MYSLYLWDGLKARYIRELLDIFTLYDEKIKPVFSDPEGEAEEYKATVWEQFMQRPVAEDSYIEPDHFVDSVMEMAYERFELFSLMRYRTRMAWISCLRQVWEQQIYKFLLDESKHPHSIFQLDSKKGGDFNYIKNCYTNFGVDFSTLNNWDKINELRLLVNVIKHGDGTSADTLRNLRPDYFASTSRFFTISPDDDLLKYHGASLLDQVLQVSDQDFKEYLDALVDFWKQLPEYMNYQSQP